MKEGMSLIVKTVARWVVGFIFLYGIYITAEGHLGPGGGFSGGIILACSYILILIAYGRRFASRNLDWRIARIMAGVAALSFLALAMLGMIFETGGNAHFFDNLIRKNLPGTAFHLFSGGNIPLLNLALAILVLASVFTAFVLLAAVRFWETRGKKFFSSLEDGP